VVAVPQTEYVPVSIVTFLHTLLADVDEHVLPPSAAQDATQSWWMQISPLPQVVASWPLCPSLAQSKLACWLGMHPPLTHTWPVGHVGPASVAVHGGTQNVSTQVVPPWQVDVPLPAHGPGFTLHTPRLRSHWKPVGQGLLDEQRDSHTPSTQAEPAAMHCDPSEQSWPFTVHWPLMHRSPLPPQSVSLLHGPVTAPASLASVPVAASGVTPESVPVEASVPADASSPPPWVTHWATPFESLQIWPEGQPVVLQSAVVPPSVPPSSPLPATQVAEPGSQTYPAEQSLSLWQGHAVQALEYEGSGHE
jgi:hypothetical protein